MKKTIRINISNFVFTIDEDAFEKLQEYLDAITHKFRDEEEGNEIIADVESRIAELFQERIGNSKEVVNLSDIDYVIEIMGEPDVFHDEDVDNKVSMTNVQDKKSGKVYRNNKDKIIAGVSGGIAMYLGINSWIIRTIFIILSLIYGVGVILYIVCWAVLPELNPDLKQQSKRIYRDPDNRVIAGVASGIAAYFGINIAIVRSLFIILGFVYGSGIVIYVLFLILVPEAKTRSQKLEMKGKDVNLSNIEISIKNEFENVKSNFSKIQQSDTYNNLKKSFSDISETLGSIVITLAKTIAILFGVVLLLSGLFALSTTTGVFFLSDSPLSPFSWNNINFSLREFARLFTDDFNAKMGVIAMYFAIIIPIVVIMYFAIKLVFQLKTKTKYLGIIIGMLWLISLGVLVYSSITLAYGMHVDENIKTNKELIAQSADTLHIAVVESDTLANNHYQHIGSVYAIFDKTGISLLGKPYFAINTSDKDIVELSINKKALGKNSDEALQYIDNLEYHWTNTGSTLYLDRFFTLHDTRKIKGQAVSINLKLPIGKIIYIDESITNIAYYLRTPDYVWINDMVNKYWIMTVDGLFLLDDYNKEKQAEIKQDNDSTIVQ